MTFSTRLYFILGFSLLTTSSQANAVLGERNPASLTAMKSMVTPNNGTVRFQTSQDDVVTIKEFLDASGTVYAVRWEGPRPPDLNVLLGRYFPEYSVAVVTTRTRMARRRLMADSSNLHISQFGRPGQLFGIVYLKNRLPDGINPEDLK